MTVSSILPTSFTFTKESELGAAGTEGLSPVSSSNDSLEEDSLKEVSAISSWMISSLLLLLVSEHSLVLLDKTSSLDLSSEFCAWAGVHLCAYFAPKGENTSGSYSSAPNVVIQ